jgi:threonine aldolase
VSDHPRGFASDNFSGAHPDVLAAIAAANDGHAPAYGDDPWTERARALFRDHFGDAAEAFPVFNGTAANVLALDALTRSFEAVICAATAHLNVDECGAPERIAGVKLLTVEGEHGKLTPELIAPLDTRRGDQHAPQPRAVSISQATELGTVYTPDEVRALAHFAHDRGMLLHVDGARLANAAAALDSPLRAITTDAGVDALSFGGTKNGLLLGDAVVFLRPGLADRFAFVRKQGMQLASKMRFLSAQFEALLGPGDLWLRNASHANAMARRLRDAAEAIDGVEIAHPVDANAVFARLPHPAIERLRSEIPGELPFYVWDEETGECRWMCTWDTTEEDVDRFAAAVDAAVGPRIESAPG